MISGLFGLIGYRLQQDFERELPAATVGAILVLSLAGPAAAQGVRLDVDRIGVDITRIARALNASTIREERDGLNLRYYVSIYGQAPMIELFTREDNLLTGPVPYTAPTHREMLDHITPQAFRAPVMDIQALAKWLSDQLSRRSSEGRR